MGESVVMMLKDLTTLRQDTDNLSMSSADALRRIETQMNELQRQNVTLVSMEGGMDVLSNDLKNTSEALQHIAVEVERVQCQQTQLLSLKASIDSLTVVTQENIEGVQFVKADLLSIRADTAQNYHVDEARAANFMTEVEVIRCEVQQLAENLAVLKSNEQKNNDDLEQLKKNIEGMEKRCQLELDLTHSSSDKVSLSTSGGSHVVLTGCELSQLRAEFLSRVDAASDELQDEMDECIHGVGASLSNKIEALELRLNAHIQEVILSSHRMLDQVEACPYSAVCTDGVGTCDTLASLKLDPLRDSDETAIAPLTHRPSIDTKGFNSEVRPISSSRHVGEENTQPHVMELGETMTNDLQDCLTSLASKITTTFHQPPTVENRRQSEGFNAQKPEDFNLDNMERISHIVNLDGSALATATSSGTQSEMRESTEDLKQFVKQLFEENRRLKQLPKSASMSSVAVFRGCVPFQQTLEKAGGMQSCISISHKNLTNQ